MEITIDTDALWGDERLTQTMAVMYAGVLGAIEELVLTDASIVSDIVSILIFMPGGVSYEADGITVELTIADDCHYDPVEVGQTEGERRGRRIGQTLAWGCDSETVRTTLVALAATLIEQKADAIEKQYICTRAQLAHFRDS